MKTTHLLGLLAALLLATLPCRAADEDFAQFLARFTGSAAFQYERIKFPLKTPITLLEEDGETERTFPFTRREWPLLDAEAFRVGRIVEDEGGVYLARFTTDNATLKEFEAGYEESEPSLRVTFERLDGKWYVTDCYNDWYNLDLPIPELPATVEEVQAENEAFAKEHP